MTSGAGRRGDGIVTAVSMLLAAAVAAGAMATVTASQQNGDDRGRDGERGRSVDRSYAIGAWGDLPYSDLQAMVGVPNLIADMNRQDLEFTIHDGDLKAGSGTPGSATPTTCSDALYTQALQYFSALKAPVIFTPGDNDWTDCDRPANGGFSSLERLDYERKVFFATPFTLGQKRFVSRCRSFRPASASPARCRASRTAAGRCAA
jgi:hypothetical protein